MGHNNPTLGESEEEEEVDNEEWIQDDGQSEASITDALSDSVCVGDEDAESDNSEEY